MKELNQSIHMRRQEQFYPNPDVPATSGFPKDRMPSMPEGERAVRPEYSNDATLSMPEGERAVRPEYSNDVTPSMPEGERAPEYSNDATPSMPEGERAVRPGFSNDVTPSMPEGERAVRPGFSNDIMPDFPKPNVNVTVVPIVPGFTRYGYIRFLNAAPNRGPVDIYVNGKLVASNLAYQEFTEYIHAMPGYYRTIVYQAGTINRPYLTIGFNVGANMIYTAVLNGNNNHLDMELIADRSRSKNYNAAYMRFVHMAPNTPAVDFYIDNRKVVADLTYGEVSNYVSLRPKMHSMIVKLAGTNQIILENPQVSLKGGNYYSTYLVGNSDGNPGLQVLIPLEGTSYLKF